MMMENRPPAIFLLRDVLKEEASSKGKRVKPQQKVFKTYSAAAIRAMPEALRYMGKCSCEYGCQKCSSETIDDQWEKVGLSSQPVVVELRDLLDVERLEGTIVEIASLLDLKVKHETDNGKRNCTLSASVGAESRVSICLPTAAASFVGANLRLEIPGLGRSGIDLWVWDAPESDAALFAALEMAKKTVGSTYGEGIGLWRRKDRLVSSIERLIPCNEDLFRIVSRCFGEIYYPSGPVRFKFDIDYFSPIDISPAYQRDSVWTQEQQKAYIRHVLKTSSSSRAPLTLRREKLDIHTARTTGEFRFLRKAEVVDGKQRLLALRAFFRNEFPVNLSPEGAEPEWAWWRQFSLGDIRAFSDGLVRWIDERTTDADVIAFYLEMNRGFVGHTPEEIERAERALEAAKESA